MSERPKVQHSKCCVVSQPPWVQIPALPPLPPGPDGAGRFCYAWMVCGRVCACCGMLLVFWAPSGLAACVVCLARPGCLVCPWAAGYLADGVPVGGGPPASRPRRELRSARRLEARPGPAAAHGPRSLAPQPSGPVGTLHTGGACVAVTSPARPYRMGTAAWVSGLSTQWCPVADADWCVVSKPGQALPPPTDSTAHGFHSLAQQVLRCPPYWSCNPLRVAVRSRFAVVSCPKCRPPRRKTLKTGCYGRSGLRFERIGTCHSALLAREPAIASVNPLCRT